MHRRRFLTGASACATLTWLPSVALSGTSAIPGRTDKVVKSEEEWRRQLTPDQFRILRQSGTERAFTGPYWDSKSDGYYLCAGCDLPLYDSRTKFDSGTGWPSFWDAIGRDHVAFRDDSGWFVTRTECVCNRCGGHLGHVFNDGPPPTRLRHCINGHALRFVPADAPQVTNLDLPKGYARPTPPVRSPREQAP